MPILEACAVIGVTVVVIAREVTVGAAAEESAEAVMAVVEAAAEAGAAKLGTTKAAYLCACESPQVTATHAAATKSPTNTSTSQSTHVAACESATNTSTSEPTTHAAATQSATNTSASEFHHPCGRLRIRRLLHDRRHHHRQNRRPGRSTPLQHRE